MKKIFLTATLLLSVSFFAQTTVEAFLSAKLGNKKRDITVKLPKSYEANPERYYPMIMVMDSEYLFPLFEANLTYGKSWDDMPDVILVGIGQNKNNERYDDCEFDANTGLPSAKGGAFFEFIGSELIPHLEKKYRISSFRGIAGVDTTAGFINTFLYKDSPLFNSFISISPELATGMEQRVAQRLGSLKSPVYYYQATSDGDLKQFQNKIKTLDEKIKEVKKDSTLNYKFDNFKGIAHYGIAPNAVPSALYHLFAVYQPISQLEYQEKIAPLKEGHVDYLNKKYETIEKVLGAKIKIRYTDLLAIESAIKKNESWYEYEQLAQISGGPDYEKTMLYDYHMGMYWEKRNEPKKAMKFYQNSFMKKEIGDITKDFMMAKAEDLKKFMPKKDKLKGGQAKGQTQETIEETPATDTPPTDNPPADNNGDKPKEEPKN